MNYLNFTIQELREKHKYIERLLNGLGVDVNENRHKRLSSVLHEEKLSPDMVSNTIQLLQTQPDSDIDWILGPVSALTNHIEEHYHRRHRIQLPELMDTAQRLETQNVEVPEYPTGIYKLLRSLYDDLIPHMAHEESIVFPMLVENKGNYIYCQVSKIMHHHDHQVVILEALKELTDNFSPPELADSQWREFYKKLAEFREELLEHIRLENEILFAST